MQQDKGSQKLSNLFLKNWRDNTQRIELSKWWISFFFRANQSRNRNVHFPLKESSTRIYYQNVLLLLYFSIEPSLPSSLETKLNGRSDMLPHQTHMKHILALILMRMKGQRNEIQGGKTFHTFTYRLKLLWRRLHDSKSWNTSKTKRRHKFLTIIEITSS